MRSVHRFETRRDGATLTSSDRRAADVLIIGGGVVGLSLALEAVRRQPSARIVLIEKEAHCGEHASGRNSGVVHAGFYYRAGSLKANLAAAGNRLLTQYCIERNLPIRRCGKLVVARNRSELAGLSELQKRGEQNGVALEMLSAREALRIEPRIRTFEQALFSPSTATVDPGAVIGALVSDARAAGVEVRTETAYLGHRESDVLTTQGTIHTGYVINAAGLQADRIARDYGFSRHHRILPFAGVYLESSAPVDWIRSHVYPVPDLHYPFLGVHCTSTVDYHIKIGPTAFPVFWREQYGRLSNFRVAEALQITGLQATLFARNAFDFRRLAWVESRKRFRSALLRQAGSLVDLPTSTSWRWGRRGIRAQLVDVRSWRLEMDFCLEGDASSLHVLNAVSPAFTCAIPFARLALDQVTAFKSHQTSAPDGQAG